MFIRFIIINNNNFLKGRAFKKLCILFLSLLFVLIMPIVIFSISLNGDTTSETPRNLTVQRNTQNSVALFWEPFSLIEPARAYAIFRDNVPIGYTENRAFVDTKIVVGKTHRYKVTAYTSSTTRTSFSNEVVIYITESTGIVYWAKATSNTGHIRGTDVSKYTPELDWNKIKADGIKYVYVRAAGSYVNEGYVVDPMASKHTVGIKSVGLPVGFYYLPHWSSVDYDIKHAKTEAKRYADHIYSLMNLSGVKSYGDLLPLLDIEPALKNTETGLRPEQIVNWARVFCDEFKWYTGRTIMIYTNRSFWQEWGITADMNTVSNLPLMNAEYYEFNNYLYSSDSTPINFGGWKGWNIWQYSQSAVIGGYTGMDASWCPSLDVITPPKIPAGIAGRNIASKMIQISWDKKREIDIIGYNIYKDGVLLTRTSNNYFIDKSGLQIGRTYTYMVQAVDKYFDVSIPYPVRVHVFK